MSSQLKGKYKRLFKRIEHGNRKHRNWLYDEMLKFQQEEYLRGSQEEGTHLCPLPNMGSFEIVGIWLTDKLR